MNKIANGNDTEDLAWKLAQALVEDFKPHLSADFRDKAEAATAARTVSAVRELNAVIGTSVYDFKCQYQLSSWFKRFIFDEDVLTPQDVHARSVKKFMDNNARLLSFDYGNISDLTRSVLFSARGWLGNTLGDFNSSAALRNCKFGKKSSVGIPKRKACEGARYEVLTGSQEQILWFKHCYGVYDRPGYEYARGRAERKKLPMFYECTELEATLVPKKFDSLRIIVPNTTIGSLHSSGIGGLMEEKLRFAGYDIRALQPIHGELARVGSVTGQLVTADQVSASDNITVKLVEMLFEPRWAAALMAYRIGDVRVDGLLVNCPTYSTMGNGITFPLQTLVFLSLLYGVKDVLGLANPVISVFGDDMIYDVSMHATVCTVFSELGLVINESKTFADGEFRESCGSDYYRGVNVRPAFYSQPATRFIKGKAFESYLYKTANALLERWSYYEIANTLNVLTSAMLAVRPKGPFGVPKSFPDTSGVHIDPEDNWLPQGFQCPVRKGHVYHFKCLSFKADRRVEYRQWPYYHRRLKSATKFVDRELLKIKGVKTLFEKLLGYRSWHMVDVIQEETLLTIEYVREDSLKANIRKGRREPTLVPTIAEIDDGRYYVVSGSSVMS